MSTVSYSSGITPQMLGGQMTPLDTTQAQPIGSISPTAGLFGQGGGMSPAMMAQMAQQQAQSGAGSLNAANAYMNANAVPGSVVTNPNAALPWLQDASAWSGS